jgi:hypothetical protein
MSGGDFDFEKDPEAENGGTHNLVETGKYKGNPTISLRRTPDDKYPFTMGLAKAKLVVDNIEAIENFVRDNAKG